MSSSVRPHRWQPTRLPHPWNFPGKNTRMGCHFLLQCMKVKSESEVTQSCPTLSNPMDCSPTGSSIHGIFQARVLEWGAITFSIINAYPYIKVIYCIPSKPYPLGSPILKKSFDQFVVAWHCIGSISVGDNTGNWLGIVGNLYISSVQLLSPVWLLVTPWTAVHQASLYVRTCLNVAITSGCY